MSAVQTRGGIRGRKRKFSLPWLAEVAREVEAEYGSKFRSHLATLQIEPMTTNRLRERGEGFEIILAPDDPARWEWWGDFESGVEVMWRRRFSRSWHQEMTEEQARDWLRREVGVYLATLQSRGKHSDAS